MTLAGKTILCLSLCAVLVVVSFTAEAQQPGKIPWIGYLASSGSGPSPVFIQGLRDLGYVEGKNIAFVFRTTEGQNERYSDLAAELVRLNVDIIVVGGNTGIRAAKKETSTIPIVMAHGGDPVAQGFVASLARPGGNITGLSNFSAELSGKRLELLREAFPNVSRVAVIWNPDAPGPVLSFKELEIAAKALKVPLEPLQVRGPKDFEGAFQTAREHAGSLVVIQDVVTVAHLKQIVELTAVHRLPAIYMEKEWAEAGGLMSYGVNQSDLHRRAAIYVDKILKGAKPADLPVEQPTKFELVINLKTAKQIG